jgi:hypothetical protein
MVVVVTRCVRRWFSRMCLRCCGKVGFGGRKRAHVHHAPMDSRIEFPSLGSWVGLEGLVDGHVLLARSYYGVRNMACQKLVHTAIWYASET